VHACNGWLTETVQPRSVTIKTTPNDRLAIMGEIVQECVQGHCDVNHLLV